MVKKFFGGVFRVILTVVALGAVFALAYMLVNWLALGSAWLQADMTGYWDFVKNNPWNVGKTAILVIIAYSLVNALANHIKVRKHKKAHESHEN